MILRSRGGDQGPSHLQQLKNRPSQKSMIPEENKCSSNLIKTNNLHDKYKQISAKYKQICAVSRKFFSFFSPKPGWGGVLEHWQRIGGDDGGEFLEEGEGIQGGGQDKLFVSFEDVDDDDFGDDDVERNQGGGQDKLFVSWSW